MQRDSGPRAVVTGIGIFTPAGRQINEFFSDLCAPTSRLQRPPEGHFAAGVVDALGIARLAHVAETQFVGVPVGVPVRIGKTVLELRR